MNPRPYKGWLVVGIVTTVAVTTDSLFSSFGKVIAEFLKEVTNWGTNVLPVQLAIGIPCGLLVAAAVVAGVWMRIKHGRLPVDVESERFAVVMLLVMQAFIVFLGIEVSMHRICVFRGEFLLASSMLLFLYSVIISVRANRSRWIPWIGLCYFLLLAVGSMLTPPVAV